MTRHWLSPGTSTAVVASGGKEVALGRLRTVSLILILGVCGGAAAVAAPDDATSATRQPPPVPPIKYLEAGSRLFNSTSPGDVKALEKAAKYLEAADRYRDMLTAEEQKLLEAYMKELGNARAAVAASAAPAVAPSGGAPTQAPAGAARPQPSPGAPVDRMAPSPRGPAGPDQIGPSADLRARARWLLHEAREKINQGSYDEAQRKADEAEALNVKWGLFDDTPGKVSEEIKNKRPKAMAKATGSPVEVHDRRAAKAKLREARAAISDRKFEQAEAIAIEVKGWGMSYGLFEDNPDKVAAAARALRSRDKLRNTAPRDQSSLAVYDVMVQESRQLVKVGRLDEAEAKARQAQRMNVVPPVTSDRAESVLHEIAMARSAKSQGAIAYTPPTPPTPPADMMALEPTAGARSAERDRGA